MNLRCHLLGIALVPLTATSHAGTASSAHVTTTVYVSPHFEVRDYDLPVKYVFNNDTRVARITGSLSTNLRLQRLRLRTGWNLISLAVSAPDLLGQFQQYTVGNGMGPLLRAVYRWRPTTGDYTMVGEGETVTGGTVLWLHARTNLVIAVRGDYAEPTAPTIPAGGAFMPGPGLEVWPLQLPPNVAVWKFDAAGRCWQTGFTGDLAPLSDIPSQLAPGEAIYVHTSESIELSIPEPELRVAYYHQDHLGSSSVVTDSAGQLAEETTYYPFGAPRHQHRPREAHTHYGFTQKERDPESGLNYYEARFLIGPLARFVSFDPLIQQLEALEAEELKSILTQPAKLNPFVYALNNPLRYTDPDGREARPRPVEARPEKPQPEYTFRIGPSSKQSGELNALSLSLDPPEGPQATGSGSGRGKVVFSEFKITRYTDQASAELFKKSHTSQHIKSVTLIFPANKEGKELRIHLTDVLIGPASVLDSPVEGKALETFTLNAGSVEFDHPDKTAPARETRGWNLRDLMISQ